MAMFESTQPSPNDEQFEVLCKIAQAVSALIASGGSFAGLTDAQLRATPVDVDVASYPSGTLSVFAKTAGQTENIPAGAFQLGVIFLTGTGTIGGVDWPVNVPFNIEARTAAQIAVVCGSPGTARINYLS